MNLDQLFHEFQSEDFEPIPELRGSGLIVGTRNRPPFCLTYEQATGKLAAHGEIATGLLLEPGEAITFEITITQVSGDRAMARSVTRLDQAEECGDRYVLLSGLLGALNGLSRAVD